MTTAATTTSAFFTIGQQSNSQATPWVGTKLGWGKAVQRETRKWIERLARTGFVAKGVVYLLLGFLGLRAALGNGAVQSTKEALTSVLNAPLGSLLLTILVLGLAWYSAWRFTESFADANRKGTEPKGLGARGIYLASGLIYGALALDAAAILLAWDNDSGQIRSVFRVLLEGPGGVIAALALIAYGLYQLWKGIAGKLSGQLREGEARREAGGWVIALSRAGLAGRALLLIFAGGWLITHPSEAPAMASSSSGASGALELVARMPEGALFLGLASAALVAYGAYQLVHSRYRRIVVP